MNNLLLISSHSCSFGAILQIRVLAYQAHIHIHVHILLNSHAPTTMLHQIMTTDDLFRKPKTKHTHTYTYLDRRNDGVLRTRIVICIYNISQFHFHYVLVGERKRIRRRRRRRKKHANAKMLNGIVQWRAENGTSIHE